MSKLRSYAIGIVATAAITAVAVTVVDTLLGEPSSTMSAGTTATVVSPTTSAVVSPVTYSTVDTSGTGSHTYRIPATAVTQNGVLVACYDARRRSALDLPSDTDVVCRRSTDEGATWSAQVLAVPHTGGSTDSTANGAGESSLLYDRHTGRLYLFYEYAPFGTGLYHSDTSISPTSGTTVHPMIVYSDDDGQTWSAPVDLISELKTTQMTGVFDTSGHGIQLADGTLVEPFAYLSTQRVWTAFLAYSTDDGATWRRGSTIGTGISENKVAQLADGSLLDDARATTSGAAYRMLSTAATVTGTWSKPFASKTMPDPQCNGDLLMLANGWLLASNPDNQTSRSNGVVRLSKDGGRTWPSAWVVDTSSNPVFGYSTMVQFADGSVGIFYEHAGSDHGRSLAFARFSLSVFPS